MALELHLFPGRIAQSKASVQSARAGPTRWSRSLSAEPDGVPADVVELRGVDSQTGAPEKRSAAESTAIPPEDGSSPSGISRPAEEAPAPGEEGEEGFAEESAFSEEELTQEEKREIARLEKRDRAVRAHEQAHLTAAGPYARGSPRYEYETGPDDKRYAVGGEVSIDTSPVPNHPEATIRKAQVVRRAALAPIDPSPQDRQIAAQASRMEFQARQELARKRAEEERGEDNGGVDSLEKPTAEEDALGSTPTSAGVSEKPPKVMAPDGPSLNSGIAKLTQRGSVGQTLDLIA